MPDRTGVSVEAPRGEGEGWILLGQGVPRARGSCGTREVLLRRQDRIPSGGPF